MADLVLVMNRENARYTDNCGVTNYTMFSASDKEGEQHDPALSSAGAPRAIHATILISSDSFTAKAVELVQSVCKAR